jgi:hypothetical protein
VHNLLPKDTIPAAPTQNRTLAISVGNFSRAYGTWSDRSVIVYLIGTLSPPPHAHFPRPRIILSVYFCPKSTFCALITTTLCPLAAVWSSLSFEFTCTSSISSNIVTTTTYPFPVVVEGWRNRIKILEYPTQPYAVKSSV